MSNWTAICALEDIPVLGSRVLLREDGNNIAIFRTGSDEVFALRDWIAARTRAAPCRRASCMVKP